MSLFTKNTTNQTSKKDLKILELIRRRRLQILVHSCIYYRFNSSLIDDATFDKFAKELVSLQKKYPKYAKKVRYSEAFEGFEGSTGYRLPMGDINIVSKAEQLLRYANNKEFVNNV